MTMNENTIQMITLLSNSEIQIIIRRGCELPINIIIQINYVVLNVNNSNDQNIKRNIKGCLPKKQISTIKKNLLSSNVNELKTEKKKIKLNIQKPIIEVLSNNSNNFQRLINEAIEGLEFYTPELCEEGVNGTYFLKNRNGKKIAVFKPDDEEGDSINNPKITNIENKINIRKGILPGEASQRELAAYYLDNEKFYGVPQTCKVGINNSFFKSKDPMKIGSFQEFIENDGTSSDIGYSIFPIHEVHKIGILDIQILNNDRNSENILFKKKKVIIIINFLIYKIFFLGWNFSINSY